MFFLFVYLCGEVIICCMLLLLLECVVFANGYGFSSYVLFLGRVELLGCCLCGSGWKWESGSLGSGGVSAVVRGVDYRLGA